MPSASIIKKHESFKIYLDNMKRKTSIEPECNKAKRQMDRDQIPQVTHQRSNLQYTGLTVRIIKVLNM
jgi:hypothetical protein